MPVEMIKVKSSNIEAVGHDPIANELHVQFKNGSKYKYLDCTAAAHSAFMKSDSIGIHFHHQIKNNFKFEKISE